MARGLPAGVPSFHPNGPPGAPKLVVPRLSACTQASLPVRHDGSGPDCPTLSRGCRRPQKTHQPGPLTTPGESRGNPRDPGGVSGMSPSLGVERNERGGEHEALECS